MHSGGLALLPQAVNCHKSDVQPAACYEEWTQLHRHALQDLLVDLLVELGKRWQERGDLAEAADAYRQVLARGGTREVAHYGLMFTNRESNDQMTRQIDIPA